MERSGRDDSRNSRLGELSKRTEPFSVLEGTEKHERGEVLD